MENLTTSFKQMQGQLWIKKELIFKLPFLLHVAFQAFLPHFPLSCDEGWRQCYIQLTPGLALCSWLLLGADRPTRRLLQIPSMPSPHAQPLCSTGAPSTGSW